MPKFLSATEINLEFFDIIKREFHPRVHHARKPGIHVSGIIRELAIQNGQLLNADEQEELMPLRMFVGMAWEEAAVTLYPDMLWQPEPLEKDGISGSPDGVTLARLKNKQDHRLIVEEFKATWKSMRHGIEEQWMWLQQTAAYCHMLDECTWARFHVLWMNGNYRERREPVYMRYEVSYTERELQGIWKNLVKNKHLAKREGEGESND